MFLMVEAVTQLRGEAGGRQVPDARARVRNGTGGWFSSSGTHAPRHRVTDRRSSRPRARPGLRGRRRRVRPAPAHLPAAVVEAVLAAAPGRGDDLESGAGTGKATELFATAASRHAVEPDARMATPPQTPSQTGRVRGRGRRASRTTSPSPARSPSGWRRSRGTGWIRTGRRGDGAALRPAASSRWLEHAGGRPQPMRLAIEAAYARACSRASSRARWSNRPGLVADTLRASSRRWRVARAGPVASPGPSATRASSTSSSSIRTRTTGRCADDVRPHCSPTSAAVIDEHGGGDRLPLRDPAHRFPPGLTTGSRPRGGAEEAAVDDRGERVEHRVVVEDRGPATRPRS